jgi:hypothetical protein
MGIVAYCPNGHRVKVKDELAGRKGLCPEGQARFRIPRETAWPADGTRSPADAGGYPVARVVSLDPAVAARLPRALGLGTIAAPVSASPAAFTEPAAPPPAAAAARSFSLHATLAERPELNWSVAVPGGQPSEPMSAEAMQRWLDAGGLTGSELVWRDGWADWVSIRLVFPEHVPVSRG